MALYRGNNPLKPYLGDGKPLNVYLGPTKLAGWTLQSYSGASPLTVGGSYNQPPDAMTISGRCVQTGTPSPDSPAPISTITGDVTITGADGASSSAVTVAFGSNVCASLPDGTHDSYDAVSGVLSKAVCTGVLDGTESWSVVSVLTTTMRFVTTVPTIKIGSVSLCDRLPYDASSNDSEHMRPTATGGNTHEIYVWIKKSRLATPDAAGLRAWLASSPLRVYYALDTPTTVQLVPHLPVVRTGIKTLTVGADVAPNLTVTVKAMD